MRKHLRSCQSRKASGHAIPYPEPRGRKRRACDQCARSKRACNFEHPCDTCSLRSLPCSYHRADHGTGSELGTNLVLAALQDDWLEGFMDLDYLESVPDAGHARENPELLSPPTVPLSSFAREHVGHCEAGMIAPGVAAIWRVLQTQNFEFLLNFEMGGGIDRVFNFMTSREQECDMLNLDTFTLPPVLVDDSAATFSDMQGPGGACSFKETVEWIFDPLLPQAKAIWERLFRRSHSHESRTSNECQDPLFINQCVEFFNPASLRRLLVSYWDRWHWHCPIIHKPSFDISQVPIEMIMVLSLLGAFVSFDGQQAVEARQWLDVVEQLVFSMPWLSRNSPRGLEPCLPREKKLRMIQTALLICVLQTWEGSSSTQSRVRELRYPHLVQVYCTGRRVAGFVNADQSIGLSRSRLSLRRSCT